MEFLDKEQALQLVRRRRRLFDAAAERNPFAGSAWMLEFIEHVARDDWTFALADCPGDGESLMLLYQDPRLPHRRAGLANHYVSLYSPLVSSARDRGVAIHRLVREVTGAAADCAAIQLSPLDAAAADTHALCRAFAEQGWYVKRYGASGNWHLPCAGLSFVDYMAGRDSRLYNTWLRKSRKFRSGAPGSPRLEIVTDRGALEPALAAYERVYARSWKTPESHPEFIRAWVRTCADNGWLRLGLAWVGEVPVAAQIWFTLHGRANIFKLAYDEDYAGWSAGTVLTAHLFRHSLDRDRVAEIDYLSGDDAYKRSWMTARRERVGLLACNPHTVRGLVLTGTEWAGEIYQRWRRFLWPPGEPGAATLP